jgi:hypothetical protein
MKILSMGAEFFHTEGRTADVMKLIVAFRNFAYSPKYAKNWKRNLETATFAVLLVC